MKGNATVLLSNKKNLVLSQKYSNEVIEWNYSAVGEIMKEQSFLYEAVFSRNISTMFIIS